jgi:hypothetical protein
LSIPCQIRISASCVHRIWDLRGPCWDSNGRYHSGFESIGDEDELLASISANVLDDSPIGLLELGCRRCRSTFKHVVLDFLRLGNMFGGLLYLNIT